MKPFPVHIRFIPPIRTAWLAAAFAILLFARPSVLTNGHPYTHGEEYSEVSLLFIGDIMQHMPQVEAAWNDSLQQYIYDSCFRYVKPVIESYDFAIANLETTLAGKPYSGYPAFSSPDELVNGLLHAGIDLVGTANNHCCDRGLKGIRRTVTMLDSLGMPHFGTYRNAAEHASGTPLILRKNGISIALLNYTYGTNGIPVPEGTVVNLIEKERLLADLKTARESRCDKIIVFIHWGEEYQREPNAFQKEIAALCRQEGADIIIGSHPHVIQPMEWDKADSMGRENLVVWSLGNFVSNQRNRYTDGGAMVGITLRKENGKTTIRHADYQLNWVYNPYQQGKKQYYILPVTSFENDSAFLLPESLQALRLFTADSRELLFRNRNIEEKNKK